MEQFWGRERGIFSFEIPPALMYRHIGQAFFWHFLAKQSEFPALKEELYCDSCLDGGTILQSRLQSIQHTSSQPLWLYFLAALSCRLSKVKLCKDELLALSSVSLCTHFQNEKAVSSFYRACGMPNTHGAGRRCSKGISVDSEYPNSSLWSKVPSKLWQTWLWVLHFSTHYF